MTISAIIYALIIISLMMLKIITERYFIIINKINKIVKSYKKPNIAKKQTKNCFKSFQNGFKRAFISLKQGFYSFSKINKNVFLFLEPNQSKNRIYFPNLERRIFKKHSFEHFRRVS
jgi:hypothetical protein